MRLLTKTEVVLDIQVGLAERYGCLLDVVRAGAYASQSPMSDIARDMDMSPSNLSRKLANHVDDPRKFNLRDLEAYLTATHDLQPVHYLVEKYLQDEQQKADRALKELAGHLPAIISLIKAANCGGRYGEGERCASKTNGS